MGIPANRNGDFGFELDLIEHGGIELDVSTWGFDRYDKREACFRVCLVKVLARVPPTAYGVNGYVLDCAQFGGVCLYKVGMDGTTISIRSADVPLG